MADEKQSGERQEGMVEGRARVREADKDAARQRHEAAAADEAGVASTAKTDTEREKDMNEGLDRPFSEGTPSNPGPGPVVYTGGDPGTPGDDPDASNLKVMNAANENVDPEDVRRVSEPAEKPIVLEADADESHSAHRRGSEGPGKKAVEENAKRAQKAERDAAKERKSDR